MITKEQTDECADALIRWFQTQECDPADGGIVMLRLIASQLVAKTQDAKELQQALINTNLVLTLEVVKALGKFK